MRLFRSQPLRHLLLLSLVVAVSSFALDASAQPHRRASREFPPGLAEARLLLDNAELLEVSEEKLAELEKLTDAAKIEEDRLRAMTITAKKKVREMINTNLPSEADMMKAANLVGEAGRGTREVRLHLSLAVRGLLTEEQLVKYMDLRANAFGKQRQRLNIGKPKAGGDKKAAPAKAENAGEADAPSN